MHILRILLLPVVWCILWHHELQERKKERKRLVKQSAYERGYAYAAGEYLRDPKQKDRLEAESAGGSYGRDDFDYGMLQAMTDIDNLHRRAHAFGRNNPEDQG